MQTRICEDLTILQSRPFVYSVIAKVSVFSDTSSKLITKNLLGSACFAMTKDDLLKYVKDERECGNLISDTILIESIKRNDKKYKVYAHFGKNQAWVSTLEQFLKFFEIKVEVSNVSPFLIYKNAIAEMLPKQ